MQSADFHLRPLTLILAIACASSGLIRTVRLPAGPAEQVSELDSFAEPSIAAAVLKKQAQDLIWAYNVSRDAAWSPKSQLDPDRERRCAPREGEPFLQGSSACAAKSQNALSASTCEWIQRFKEAIHQREDAALASGLEDQLLHIYEDNGLWNEVIDCYLGILSRRPDSPLAVAWAPLALDRSTYCNRTEEVRDALEHVARFSRDRKLAARIKTVLAHRSDANRRNCIAGAASKKI